MQEILHKGRAGHRRKPTYAVKDFLVLSATEQIRAVAREERLEMLSLLAREPLTVSEIARHVGMAPNRAHYHIQQLLKHGLVRQVATGVKRFREERFYQAVARNYIMDPQLACAQSETASVLMQSTESLFLDWRRREILDIDLSEVAAIIVAGCLRIGRGETVLVMFGPHGLELAEAVIVEIDRVGAMARPKLWSRNVLKRTLDRNPPEALAELPFLDAALEAEVDAVVYLSSSVPQGPPLNDAQREKLPLLMNAASRWQRGLKERNVRYLEFALPHRLELSAGRMTAEEVADTYWRCVRTSYADLHVRAAALLAALADHPRLVLTSGADARLELALDPAHFLINDGVISDDDLAARRCLEVLPAGSLSLLPLLDSANGTFVADYVFVGGEHVWDVQVELRDGRIVGVEASQHVELIETALAGAAGEPDRLASVGFGVNPAGVGPTGMPVLDGCLAGVVTLGFGNNELLGGTVRATLDLTFPATAVSVSAGSKRLVVEGKLGEVVG